ncbi:hypothetical protein GMSM_17040 [Geomonas sp. Red276]
MLRDHPQKTVMAAIVAFVLPWGAVPVCAAAPGTVSGGKAAQSNVTLTVAPSPPDGNNPAKAASLNELQVVGFSINGNSLWQKKSIGDLDVIVTPPGKRYLPLFRLLKLLDIDRKEDGGTVTFQPDGMPFVTLDRVAKTYAVDKRTRSIDLIEARSEASREQDIYLLPEALAELFGIELAWSEANYEFVGHTARKLRIWKSSSKSAHELLVQDVPTNLPEMHPQATPKRNGLDFAELSFRTNFSVDNNFAAKQGSLDNMNQVFWGSFLGSAYKLHFAEREIDFGGQRSQLAGAGVMLYRGEWNKRYSNLELSVGDSAFGLSDLSFPSVRITGVRINGLAGYCAAENLSDRSKLGQLDYFVQPQVFEGVAPRGAQVELRVNGRMVETQEAVPAVDSELGAGVYRFSDVILAPGSLNEILITITDGNGLKTYVKKELLGSTLFLPAGKLAYLAGAGTNRDILTWHTRGIFTGGRALYAVNDHFTIGSSLGYQQDLFSQWALDPFNPQRQFPDAGGNAGGEFLWKPVSYLVLGGDSAFSNGTNRKYGTSYDGLAAKLKANLYPSREMQILTQYFRYGGNFFNGQNALLHDRQGYSVNGSWKFHPDWTLRGVHADISNNLAHKEAQTLDMSLQNLEISSNAIPHTTVTASVNRTAANWETEKIIYILKLYALVTPRVMLSGAVAMGDSQYLAGNTDFANGINITGLAVEDPSSFVTLAVSTSERNELDLTYAQSFHQEKIIFTHKYRNSQSSLRTKTDVGYDTVACSSIVKNRSTYLLDRFGDKSLELTTNYENKILSMVLSFNFVGLFDFHNRVPAPVTSRYIQPDNGSVTGRVFIDYNANGEPDPGEPGLANVKVILGGNSCLTDANGYFRLPNSGEMGSGRVFIDLATVPAIYSPTHGLQKAYIVPGIVTEVDLGVTPVISLSGVVVSGGVGGEKRSKPLYGVRVFATKPGDRKVWAESSTAGDGSYYLGDLRPGRYLVQIDKESLPVNTAAESPAREIEIAPGREPQELKMAPFTCTVAPAKVIEPPK